MRPYVQKSYRHSSSGVDADRWDHEGFYENEQKKGKKSAGGVASSNKSQLMAHTGWSEGKVTGLLHMLTAKAKTGLAAAVPVAPSAPRQSAVCLTITNLPLDVTADDLINEFRVSASVSEVSEEPGEVSLWLPAGAARIVINKYNGVQIDGLPMQFSLTEHFEPRPISIRERMSGLSRPTPAMPSRLQLIPENKKSFPSKIRGSFAAKSKANKMKSFGGKIKKITGDRLTPLRPSSQPTRGRGSVGGARMGGAKKQTMSKAQLDRELDRYMARGKK